MIVKNFNISSKIISIKIIQKNQLAILIEDENSCKIRVIDSITKKPSIACKMDMPDNRNNLFFIVDDFACGYSRKSKEIYIMQLNSCSIEYTNNLHLYHDNITQLIMSDSGYFYATGDDLGSICFWNIKQEKPKFQSISTHKGKVTSLHLDKKNQSLISGGEDGNINFYELDNDGKRTELKCHERVVSKLLFFQERFLSIDISGLLCIWDKKTKKTIHKISLELSPKEMILSYGETCAFILTTTNHLYLINLMAVNQKPIVIDEDIENACSLTFNERDFKLIVSTKDGQIRFYDLDKDDRIIAYAKLRQIEPKIEENTKKQLCFLIVDDSRLIRYTALSAIKVDFPDAKILEAPDGKVALNLLHEEEIDFIILDWNMPEFTGEEIVKYVRAFKKFDHIQIIMATTEGEKEKIIKVMKYGANGYIVKPFNQKIILDKIHQLIENPKNS